MPGIPGRLPGEGQGILPFRTTSGRMVPSETTGVPGSWIMKKESGEIQNREKRAGKGQVTRFNTRMKADIAIVTIRTATGLM